MSKAESIRERQEQEREQQEHDHAVNQIFSDFKVLWANGWEASVKEGRLVLISSLPVHESVRGKVLAGEGATMLEALGRLRVLALTETGLAVLRDARLSFEKWLDIEKGG